LYRPDFEGVDGYRGCSQSGHCSGYRRPSTAGMPYSALSGLCRRMRRPQPGHCFILLAMRTNGWTYCLSRLAAPIWL